MAWLRPSSFGEHRAVSGPSVPSMFNALTITQIYVLDQDQALDFYVGKLGVRGHTTTCSSARCAG